MLAGLYSDFPGNSSSKSTLSARLTIRKTKGAAYRDPQSRLEACGDSRFEARRAIPTSLIQPFPAAIIDLRQTPAKSILACLYLVCADRRAERQRGARVVSLRIARSAAARPRCSAARVVATRGGRALDVELLLTADAGASGGPAGHGCTPLSPKARTQALRVGWIERCSGSWN